MTLGGYGCPEAEYAERVLGMSHSSLYENIYQRERYQCASPTCERRDLTPHHLLFRSQGGGDDPDNVVGLCTWCHLHGIHTHGSIKAEPPATQMIWKTPALEVHGRELVWRRR